MDPTEPTSELRHISIRECGEPLVDFLQACPALVLDRPRFNYRRETLLREGACERLCRAAAALPGGYRIGVIEGWRAPFIQRRMFQAVWAQFRERFPDLPDDELRVIVEQFSAPMDEEVPPPHTTGGAVDLWLFGPDGPCDMNSPFDWKDHHGFAFDAEGISDAARRHRDILAEALTAGGLTNYPSEYWHWSYGDQGWAYRGGHPHAVYGAVEPTNWHPDPADVSDHPLEFV
jgi:zinc D-Ala-D-Ala dipeptidase